MYELLIVDDEKEICNGFAHFFPWQEQGFRIAGTATDVPHALDFLLTHHVDVIMTDIVMAKTNGLEFAAILQEKHPDIQVVIMSGYSDFEYARKAIQENIFAYLLKSDTYEILKNTLCKLKTKLDERYGIPDSSDSMTTLLDYIKRNCAICTLQNCADLLHMNKTYFCTYFKNETGICFHEFVVNARMEKAKHLLDETNLKIYQIAHEIGYSDANNLNRVFKQKFGLTPRDYLQRKHMQYDRRN